MSLIRSFISQPPLALARELIAIVLIMALATALTIVLNGPGAGEPFDTRLDQMPLPF
jgi:hypothetical protein